MHEWALCVVNLLVLASMVSILVTVMSPIGFEAIYTRNPGSVVKSSATKNDSIKSGGGGDAGEKWPYKMRLRMVSYWCDAPKPNFDVTDEQLNEAWSLPPKTRLSKLMRETGRCKLASKSMLINSGRYFDDGKCMCVDAWWPVMIFVVTCASLAFFALSGCGGPCVFGNGRRARIDEIRSARSWAAIWAVIWYTVIMLYGFRNADVGFSFTTYGDMYPQGYYHNEPVHWFIVFVLCLANFMLEGLKFMIFAAAVRRRVAKRRPNVDVEVQAEQALPPPYESLPFQVGNKGSA